MRQWGLRGGPARNGWMIGPELDRAFLLVEKFCDGEGANPPICPPELIVSRPHSFGETDPTIEMVDGFQWKIKHATRQGKNMTGRSVHVVWWTEAATSNSPMDFVRVRGRTVQSKGQIYLDAVPESRNWVKSSVLDAAAKEREEIEALPDRGQSRVPTYRVIELSSAGNPWVEEAEAEAFMRDLKRIDARVAAREAGGEWVSDRDLLYDFDESTVSFDSNGADPLRMLGYEDATHQASLRWFTRPVEWIVAVDVNANPHTALIGKICVAHNADMRVPTNWRAVFLDVLQVWGKDSEQAAFELRQYRGGAYESAGIVIDATSTLSRHNAGGATNARRGIIPREAYESAGYEVRGPAAMVGQPGRFQNPGRADSALVTRKLLRDGLVRIDRHRCIPFIEALRNQEAEPDGVTPLKVSNTRQDRHIAAFTDVFRYWTWPFFSLPLYLTKGSEIDVKVYG